MNEKKCREIVLERSQGRCERCGERRYLTIHHRKKRSQGGEWAPSNCVAVCGSGTSGCHGWIEAHPDFAEEEGFHVRPWQNPEDIHIFHWNGWYIKLSSGKAEYTDIDKGER